MPLYRNPVGEYTLQGYYKPYDLVQQMIIYADITDYRTAVMMKIAEEEKTARRSVVFFTENPSTLFLINNGFILYEPGMEYTASDIDIIIDAITRGQSIIFSTNNIGNPETKRAMIHQLVSALCSGSVNISNLSMIFENVEQLYSRTWDQATKSGMPTFMDLLGRAKAEHCHVAFAAQSSRNIPRKLADSCSTTIIGRISNRNRAIATAKDIDPRLIRQLDKPFGILMQSEKIFHLYNRTTAQMQGASETDLPEDIKKVIESMAKEGPLPLPTRLKQEDLQCKFDPDNPKRYRRSEIKIQSKFERKIKAKRDEVNALTSPANITSAYIPTAKIAASNGVANDNHVRPAQKIGHKREKRFDAQTAIALMRNKGFANPADLVIVGLKVISASKMKLNERVIPSLTPLGMMRRLAADNNLRKAIIAGVDFAAENSVEGLTKVSAPAYAAAYYEALQSEDQFADLFQKQVNVETLQKLGAETDELRSSESQYQFLRGEICRIQRANKSAGKQAA